MPKLEQAFARYRRPVTDDPQAARISAAAFRAAVQTRLRALEREVGELKGRVNGLIFLVAGTVIAQVLLKLVR